MTSGLKKPGTTKNKNRKLVPKKEKAREESGDLSLHSDELMSMTFLKGKAIVTTPMTAYPDGQNN